MYNVLYTRIFRGAGAGVALQKSLADNFIHAPFLYFPAYYISRSVFNGGSPAQGLQAYQEDGREALLSCWGIWIPGQFINFVAVPPQYRIVFIGALGFVWEVVLSYIAPMQEDEAKVV